MPKPVRNRRRQTEALYKQPELEVGQCVGRVIQACGENIYQVELEDTSTHLYTLPKRLRYVTFVKRGSFVFVRDDETRTRDTGTIRGDIELVVLDHFLSMLKKKDFWPSHFSSSSNALNQQPETHPITNDKEEKQGEEEEEEEDGDWTIGMGNPNRDKWKDLGHEDDSDDDADDD